MGALRVLAVITHPPVTAAILEHLDTRAPRAPHQPHADVPLLLRAVNLGFEFPLRLSTRPYGFHELFVTV